MEVEIRFRGTCPTSRLMVPTLRNPPWTTFIVDSA
jgi:hypothetical protein